MLNLSENLIRLRREKGVTQEELATFIGVTKASVSKWETGQSMPDILLLPLLAAYFDVTVDALLGYEPQLSKEQIRALYRKYCADFAEKPLEEVMEETRRMVKKQYSCYPFLAQICVLWLNHSLELEEEKQKEVWKEIHALCTHILENCRDTGICSDVRALCAVLDLKEGHPQEVIDALEDALSPVHNNYQSEGVLAQAYQMTGQLQKAESSVQIWMYLHLLSLVSLGMQEMAFSMAKKERTAELLRRMDGIIELFDLGKLHPNMTAQYEYQAAVMYCMWQDAENAIVRLERFADCCEELLSGGLILREDVFFDCISAWFEELELGNQAPRDRRKVVQSVKATMENPVFAPLAKNKRFLAVKTRISKVT